MVFERGPYLAIAAFCEQVIEDKSGVLSLIRVVDRQTVTAQGPNAPETMPPSQINWTFVMCFKSGEARGSHEIKTEIERPSGLRTQPLIQTAHFEGGNRGVNLVNRMNLRLEEPGVYWFRIYVDDVFVTQVPLEIIYSRSVTPLPPSPPPPSQ